MTSAVGMTVDDLRDALRDLDGGLLVVLSGDAEGNECSPWTAYSTARYQADSAWRGELVDEAEWEDDDDGPPGVDCVVLWPT